MDILTGTGRYAQSRGMLGTIAHRFAPSPHAGNWWFQQDRARAHTLNPKTAAGRRTEAAPTAGSRRRGNAAYGIWPK
eukprot:scaffold17593_cov147-Isochrysis_galbana.AAC.3